MEKKKANKRVNTQRSALFGVSLFFSLLFESVQRKFAIRARNMLILYCTKNKLPILNHYNNNEAKKTNVYRKKPIIFLKKAVGSINV